VKLLLTGNTLDNAGVLMEQNQIDSQFQPGTSGNSKGRPKGAKNKNHNRVSRIVEKLAATNAKDLKTIIDNVIKLAAAGDPALMLAVLARVWPVPKSPSQNFIKDCRAFLA
jgi:Family of unknown function (DUF5681)